MKSLGITRVSIIHPDLYVKATFHSNSIAVDIFHQTWERTGQHAAVLRETLRVWLKPVVDSILLYTDAQESTNRDSQLWLRPNGESVCYCWWHNWQNSGRDREKCVFSGKHWHAVWSSWITICVSKSWRISVSVTWRQQKQSPHLSSVRIGVSLHSFNRLFEMYTQESICSAMVKRITNDFHQISTV